MAETVHADRFGGPVDLRQADDYRVFRTEVSSINVASGTVALDAVSFTPNDPIELLAVGLRVIAGLTHDSSLGPDPRVARERQVLDVLLTQEDTFDLEGDRSGDYIGERFHIFNNGAFQDDAGDGGGTRQGIPAAYWAVMDPGKDSAESRLFVDENDTLRIHKRIGATGISSIEELIQEFQMHVWFNEVEAEETEVRTSFPSREGLTI